MHTATATAVPEVSISRKEAALLFGKTIHNVVASRYGDSKTVFGATIGLTKKHIHNVTCGRAHRHTISTLELVVAEAGKHLDEVEVNHLNGLIKVIKSS